MGKSEVRDSKKKRDNLEAARIVRDALEGFPQEQQKIILRWAGESLGLDPSVPAPLPRTPVVAASAPPASLPPASAATGAQAKTPGNAKDIKTFVDQKNPQTDIHLATTIAYFYRFEAPEKDRREEIDATFLRDACRLAGRPGQLVKPAKTLNNAHAKGLLDRSSPGRFSINTVGENLVGMTLPIKSAGKKAPKND